MDKRSEKKGSWESFAQAIVNSFGDNNWNKYEVIKVYEVYDYPRSFLTKNPFGKRFPYVFFFNIDDNSWVFLFMTETRVTELENKILSLREAFVDSEDGCIHRIYKTMDKIHYLCEDAYPENMCDFLPIPGIYL